MKKITTLLMAAGQSSRMGQNKLLLPIEGQSLLRRTAETLLKTELGASLTVITGHESARAHAALESLPIHWVHNQEHLSGLLSSLQAGIRACDDSTDAVMVVLADQVHLNSDHLAQLIRFFNQNPECLTAPLYGDQRGHPVIIPRRFFVEILAQTESPDKGAQFLFKNHADAVRLLKFPEGKETQDLDTPEDYDRLLETTEGEFNLDDQPILKDNQLNSKTQEVYS